jgi:hypothetical protein
MPANTHEAELVGINELNQVDTVLNLVCKLSLRQNRFRVGRQPELRLLLSGHLYNTWTISFDLMASRVRGTLIPTQDPIPMTRYFTRCSH